MQNTKDITMVAMFVEKILQTSHLHFVDFKLTQQHSCLLSKSALGDYIDSKTKKTLKRIKSQVSAKSMQCVRISQHSQSCNKIA